MVVYAYSTVGKTSWHCFFSFVIRGRWSHGFSAVQQPLAIGGIHLEGKATCSMLMNGANNLV